MHQDSNRFARPWRRCSLLPSWFSRQCFLGFFHTSFHASKYASKECPSAFNLQLSLSTFFLSFLFSTWLDFSGCGIGYTQNFHESHMYLLVLCPLHADLHVSTQDWWMRANVWDKHGRQLTGTEALIFIRRRETHQGKSDTFQTIRTQTRMQQRQWERWCYNFLFLLEVLCIPVSLWDFCNVKCNINKIYYYYYCEGIWCQMGIQKTETGGKIKTSIYFHGGSTSTFICPKGQIFPSIGFPAAVFIVQNV